MGYSLRDELAMSLGSELVPTIENKETAEHISEKFGIELNWEDPVAMIEFALYYQATIRYMYADAMLKARDNI